MGAHPVSEESLARFAANTATREEKTAVARHLLAGCRECGQRLGLRWKHRASVELETLDGVLDRSFERVDHLVSPEPRELLAELESHPFRRQETMVRNHARFRHAGLCDLLIERSRAQYRDLKRARQAARLALLIADQLDGSDRRVQERQARAWAALGNALRLQGDLPAAGKAFAEAQKRLDAGAGDALQAHLFSLWASLRFDQRRFEESVHFCRLAGAIHRKLRNPHETGRALVQEGTAVGESGRPGEGVRLLIEAGRMIEGDREPALALVAGHNIVRFYTDAGRPREAMRLYVELRDLYREVSDPVAQVKATWLEGQMMTAEGHSEPAVTLLLRARTEFLQREMSYEAALASLDLAAAFAKLGRFSALRDLVEEILPIFRTLGVRREAIASALLLRQANDAQFALEIIRKVAAQVKAASARPRRRRAA